MTKKNKDREKKIQRISGILTLVICAAIIILKIPYWAIILILAMLMAYFIEKELENMDFN